ncbi:MAG: hypothetical protein ACRECO_13365 [Xanthobacteraceae bacterium]
MTTTVMNSPVTDWKQIAAQSNFEGPGTKRPDVLTSIMARLSRKIEKNGDSGTWENAPDRTNMECQAANHIVISM